MTKRQITTKISNTIVTDDYTCDVNNYVLKENISSSNSINLLFKIVS